jgi:hypothetical protein
MEMEIASGRPTHIGRRGLDERRLINDVITDLTAEHGGRIPFGRLVRLVHLTALTAMPAGASGEPTRRRLADLCRRRLWSRPARMGSSRHREPAPASRQAWDIEAAMREITRPARRRPGRSGFLELQSAAR